MPVKKMPEILSVPSHHDRFLWNTFAGCVNFRQNLPFVNGLNPSKLPKVGKIGGKHNVIFQTQSVLKPDHNLCHYHSKMCILDS